MKSAERRFFVYFLMSPFFIKAFTRFLATIDKLVLYIDNKWCKNNNTKCVLNSLHYPVLFLVELWALFLVVPMNSYFDTFHYQFSQYS